MIEVHDASTLQGDVTLRTQTLVIGSGAGGAVVAAELAEAGHEVLILEEGAYHAAEAYGRMRPSESLRHLWRDGGMTAAIGLGNTPSINVTMGRCVGGSSVVTGGVCFRTPDHVLNHWTDRLGLTELSPATLEPFFTAVENEIGIETVPEALRSPSTVLFADGAAARGIPIHPIQRNTRGCQGRSMCNFGCPHQAKRSVDLNFLPRAVARGAQLWSRVLVERITVDGDRATGAVGRLLDRTGRPTGRLRVTADRVIAAAGAWHSPLLLKRTGLGRLSDQVGKRLTLHPGFRMVARFAQPVHGWQGALQSAFSDAFGREGMTLVSVFVPPGVLVSAVQGAGPRFMNGAAEASHFAAFGGIIHDEGGGTVHRLIGREPLVTYRMSRHDRALVPRIIRILAETFFAAGAEEALMPVMGLGPVSADRLRRLDLDHLPPHAIECVSQHPLGSCRMGSDPHDSVVDPQGQTWEVRNLFVADGSILPTSLGVNPQLTIMAMAARIGWGLATS